MNTTLAEPQQDAQAQGRPAPTGDVYTRLYDRRSYTGVYRKRFEVECYDRSERVVHDLSNTMRTNLNYDVDPRTKRASSPRVRLPTATDEVPAMVTTRGSSLVG